MTVGPYTGPKINRRPSFKGRMMVDVHNGQMRVRAWPRKRGNTRTAATREQNEKFTQAQFLAKYLDPEEIKIAMEATANTPLLPRDLLTMIIYARAWFIEFDDGRVLYTRPMMNDVSNSLDVITDQPGNMLVRGAENWEGTPVSGAAGNGVGYLATFSATNVPYIDIPLIAGTSQAELVALIRARTSNVEILARVTTDAFFSVESGATAYCWNEARAFPTNSLTNTSAANASSVRVATNVGSTFERAFMGTINILAPGDAAFPTEIDTMHGRINGSGEYNRGFGGGRYKALAAINGVRLYASSGNIDCTIDSYVWVR